MPVITGAGGRVQSGGGQKDVQKIRAFIHRFGGSTHFDYTGGSADAVWKLGRPHGEWRGGAAFVAARCAAAAAVCAKRGCAAWGERLSGTAGLGRVPGTVEVRRVGWIFDSRSGA